MERLISMMLRRFIGKMMRQGVAKVANPEAEAAPKTEQDKQMGASAKRNQQLMGLGRRIGRM